jgi:hypothetical protein
MCIAERCQDVDSTVTQEEDETPTEQDESPQEHPSQDNDPSDDESPETDSENSSMLQLFHSWQY